MKVEMIQFLRPDGYECHLTLEIPDFHNGIDLRVKYQLMKMNGAYFTCEQLHDGEAVQYISHALGDFRLEMTPPYDKVAAEKMLLDMLAEFDEGEFNLWLEDQRYGAEGCETDKVQDGGIEE